MVKPLNKGKLVVFVSFRQEKSSIVEKCFKLCLKFSFFDAISVEFPRLFVKGSNTINNKKHELCITFFEENVSALYFKNTSEWLQIVQKNSTSSFLHNLCLLFESFWSQNDGKRSTKIELILLSAFKEIFADFGWKKDQNWMQNLKNVKKFCRVLAFSVNFNLRLEHFGKIKASKSSRW